MTHDYPDLSTRGAMQWNGIHRDSRNSDACPWTTNDELAARWTALDGAAVLFGPAIDARGGLYITTGQGSGHTHLHSLDADGSLRWQAPPDTDGGPESRICTDVPLFDADGRFYVSGEDSVYAYDADGQLVWSADLRGHGARGGFVSSILTAEGLVGGITLNAQMLLLDRERGELARPALTLPTGDAFPVPPRMPGLWDRGMLDPALKARIEPGFFGYGFPVTSSPAVSPDGLIVITVADAGDNSSRLVGLRVRGAGIVVEFQTAFAGSCTASPAISPDGGRIYTVNGHGRLHGFDAGGRLLWTCPGGGAAASPAVGMDDTVYTAGVAPGEKQSCLMAVDGSSGEVAWRRNYDEVAARHLTERKAMPPYFLTDRPVAVANSVPTVTPDRIWMAVTLGYPFIEPKSGLRLNQPHKAMLLAIDPRDGTLCSETPMRDTSEAVIAIGKDGRIYTCHASLLSSVFYYGINPMLPESHRTALRPVGGLSAYSPVEPLS